MTEQTDVDGYASIISATGPDAAHPFYYGGSWCDGESGEFAGVFMFGWSLPRFRLLRAAVRGLACSDMFPGEWTIPNDGVTEGRLVPLEPAGNWKTVTDGNEGLPITMVELVGRY